MNLCTLMYVTFSLHSLTELFFFYRDAWLFYVCNFLVHSLAEPSGTFDKIINKHTVHRPKTDNTLFKITTRGLLLKTFKVLSIPSMR